MIKTTKGCKNMELRVEINLVNTKWNWDDSANTGSLQKHTSVML